MAAQGQRKAAKYHHEVNQEPQRAKWWRSSVALAQQRAPSKRTHIALRGSVSAPGIFFDPCPTGDLLGGALSAVRAQCNYLHV